MTAGLVVIKGTLGDEKATLKVREIFERVNKGRRSSSREGHHRVCNLENALRTSHEQSSCQ